MKNKFAPALWFALSVSVSASSAHAQNDCALTTTATATMQVARIALLNARGERVEVDAWIADDAAERAGGYQHICPRVIKNTVMLFRYPSPAAGKFHMHNVKAPLAIGFFDRDGVLMQSMLMLPYAGGDEVLYAPFGKFKFALEAREGFFADNNLLAGSSKLILDSLP